MAGLEDPGEGEEPGLPSLASDGARDRKVGVSGIDEVGLAAKGNRRAQGLTTEPYEESVSLTMSF
jgi:hypothetical protein